MDIVFNNVILTVHNSFYTLCKVSPIEPVCVLEEEQYQKYSVRIFEFVAAFCPFTPSFLTIWL